MATGIPVSDLNWDAARNPVGAIAARLCRAFAGGASAADPTSFWALSPATRLYVATATALGAFLTIWFAPSGIANPMAFATLVVLSCLTSTWKVMLPLSLSNNCTLSVSYVADLMALMLLGPHEAMIVALAGAWVQCTVRVKQRYPPYRTAFSLAAEVITMQATGVVYAGLGGFAADANLIALQKPLVGAIVTYFLVNSTIFAVVIALAGRQRVWRVWNENFLWSAPSFMVAGVMGAIAATIIQHGHHWLAVMMFAPVYLTYRTYHVFLGRIQDQQRHVEETRQLHAETVEALLHARRAEQALAAETKRLTVTLRSIGDGVITTDLGGTWRSGSPAGPMVRPSASRSRPCSAPSTGRRGSRAPPASRCLPTAMAGVWRVARCWRRGTSPSGPSRRSRRRSATPPETPSGWSLPSGISATR
jgi:PAS domain-containing protein